MRFRTLAAVVLVGALVLVTHGCSDSEDGGDTTGATATILQQFCELAVQACTSVTQAECEQIVNDAAKSPEATDIACASDAQDCNDTGVCLDQITDDGAGSQPTS